MRQEYLFVWRVWKIQYQGYGAPNGTYVVYFLIRGNDLLNPYHDLLIHGHALLPQSHDLLIRSHEFLRIINSLPWPIILWPRILKSFRRLINSWPPIINSWPIINYPPTFCVYRVRVQISSILSGFGWKLYNLPGLVQIFTVQTDQMRLLSKPHYCYQSEGWLNLSLWKYDVNYSQNDGLYEQ